ncbi:energy transducer TonB [Bdellovibrio bacteriovorus]|uniref:Siderophore-mediated iron transport protein n=1 Tax=Bdellovibrio bacteriovorus TaxID=959 RepID=A0A1Z3ND66_BDEBC|nr:energy transducer TonB [Bdellovibrio bacteriovorus]ASD65401.1 siderophore-mediated iron transport protein [Bdellovibrio bacteriovorus]
MSNKQFSLSLNISRSVTLSVLLHGGLFALAVGMAAPEVLPLPVGVELQYGDGGTVQAPKHEQQVKAAKMKAPVVADNSEGPAIKSEKVTEAAPQPVANGKAAGSLAGTSDKGGLEGREGVVNGSEVSPEQRYLYEIKKLLERRKRYPMLAKKMGQTGKVTMRFTLAQDGSLLTSEIVEKTPYDSLNQAALDLVKGIHGLKPFPQEIQRGSWSITVPIEYVLN